MDFRSCPWRLELSHAAHVLRLTVEPKGGRYFCMFRFSISRRACVLSRTRRDTCVGLWQVLVSITECQRGCWPPTRSTATGGGASSTCLGPRGGLHPCSNHGAHVPGFGEGRHRRGRCWKLLGGCAHRHQSYFLRSRVWARA